MSKKRRKIMNLQIPLFFSCDDNYVPYLAVTIKSLQENMNKDVDYLIYVLHTDINLQHQNELKKLEKDNLNINFFSLKDKIKNITKELDDVRDYYTQTIFYRLFIASLFPNLKKAIYLDCDIVILNDLVDFYNIDLKDNILGCVVDGIVKNNPEFKVYVKETLGVEQKHYFNSGVLLINLEEYRKSKVEEAFFDMIEKYRFVSVAPDQDFLNFVCQKRYLELDEKWNRMPIEDSYQGELKIIHYNMFMKPWLYDNVVYEDYFWKYAKETSFYDFIINKKNNYSSEMKQQDLEGVKRMEKMCADIIKSGHTYVKKFSQYIK